MSFFKQFPQIDYDIQENGEISKIYDIYRHVDVVNKKTDDFTSYTFYEIKDGDRPDIISQKLYGTPDYYWTFFIINDFLQHGYNYFYKSYQTFMRGLQLEYEGKGALVVLPNYDTSFNILGGIDISNDIIKIGRKTTINDYQLLNLILNTSRPGIDIIKVIRNIDGAEKLFTLEQITDGTLESWVNASFDEELPLDQATGAAAAYSLRNLKASGTDVTTSGDTAGDTTGKYVVQVRRSSDDAVQSFTASEVADGTLQGWAGELHNYLTLPSSFGHWQASSTGGQTDPDGGAGAYLLTHTGASISNPNGRTSNVPFGAGTYTFSCYFKEGTWDVVNLFFDDYDGTRFSQEFDLSSGSLGSDQNGNVDNATITDVGSGWYFCTMTVTSSTTIYDDVGVGLYSDTPFASASGETAYYYQPHVVRGTEPATEYIAKSVPIFGDGHVRTWYDQSGSDNHAVQTTPANQPTIVEGGVILDGINIDATNENLVLPNTSTLGISGSNARTVMAVMNSEGVDDGFMVLGGWNGTDSSENHFKNYRLRAASSDGTARVEVAGYNTPSSVDVSDGNKHLMSSILSGTTTADLDISGDGTISAGSGTDTIDTGDFPLYVGFIPNRTQLGFGSIQELIIYDSDQSTKRRAIEENIANHYDISLAAFSRDGTIDTWYDEALINADSIKQSKIVVDGSLLTNDTQLDSLNEIDVAILGDPISWNAFNLQLIVDNVTDESIFFDDNSTDRYSLVFKNSATSEQKVEWLKEFNEAQRELKGPTYIDLDESTLSSFEFTAERRYEELITAPYSYYATIDVTDEVSIGDKINAYDAARSGYGDLDQFTTYYQHEEDENELSRKLKVVRPQEIEQFTEQYKTLINS